MNRDRVIELTSRVFIGCRSRISKRLVVLLGISAGLGLIIVTLTSFMVVRSYEEYIVSPNSDTTARVGIVFGAGITDDGKPFKELQARLDSAATAMLDRQIEYILVSGDNRFENYNEPDAMKQYLIDQKGIDESKVFPDYAGRSTYETCERANAIFSIEKAILFSAKSHLPRAIFTCRSFGVESYGIGNDVEANNATRRELLARTKALFNVYIYGEETILGDPITIE